MFHLNNPLVLLAGKLLGVGVELRMARVDGTVVFCFEVEAVAWKYCKEWGNAG